MLRFRRRVRSSSPSEQKQASGGQGERIVGEAPVPPWEGRAEADLGASECSGFWKATAVGRKTGCGLAVRQWKQEARVPIRAEGSDVGAEEGSLRGKIKKMKVGAGC